MINILLPALAFAASMTPFALADSTPLTTYSIWSGPFTDDPKDLCGYIVGHGVLQPNTCTVLIAGYYGYAGAPSVGNCGVTYWHNSTTCEGEPSGEYIVLADKNGDDNCGSQAAASVMWHCPY